MCRRPSWPEVVQGVFMGKKRGSGWPHTMGEIWIRGEKGAQAGDRV